MRLKNVGYIFLSLLLLSTYCFAQAGQTGTLDGTVTTDQGVPIPGVSVVIKSPALILPQKGTVTTENGNFRFPALSPGVYSITFKLDGFKTLIREDIRVNVGVSTSISVGLNLAAVSEFITVTGLSPVVDKQRTALTANLNTEFLQSMPVARTVASFFNMTPGVTGDTAHGSTTRDNSYNLDGVNVGDPVTGTEGGSFSVDIMEELSVQTAGTSVEFGNVRGGVINVVTKSGGNTLHGGASAYYQGNEIFGTNMQANNAKGTIFAAQQGGFDYEIEPGINLGGSIIKDKLWFFMSLSLKKSQQFSPGYPWDAKPQDPQVALDLLNYYPYFKLSYQLSKNDKLILSFNYFNQIRHHREAGSSWNVESTWNQKTPVYTYNIQWTKLINSNLYMNVKGAYVNYHLLLTAKTKSPNYYDSVLVRNSKGYGYDDLYGRFRKQFNLDATQYIDNLMGSHEVKFGIEGENSNDYRNRIHYKDPVTGMGPFLNFKNGVPDYASIYDDILRKEYKLGIGVFVSDTWNPIRNLSVNYGVRYDYQAGYIPVQGLDRSPIKNAQGVLVDPRVQNKFKALEWNSIAPRIGLSYDIFGDGKTAIKAGLGRYYGSNIMQYFIWVNPNGFISYRLKLDKNMNPTGDKYNFSAQADSSLDPNLKAPYTDEITAGIEREVINNVRLGVRYIRKYDRNVFEGVDLNAMNYQAYLDGADIMDPSVWPGWEKVTGTYNGKSYTFYNRKDTSISTKMFYTNPPGAKRDYEGVEVTFEKRFANKWQLNASYVYAHSYGLIATDFNDTAGNLNLFNNPNAHIYASGVFPLERKHQFKAQGLYQGPWGINISFAGSILAGRHYTEFVRSQDMVPKITLKQGNVSINAEPLGSQTLPTLKNLDLRLEKSFKLPGKVGKIFVFADCFNVFNSSTATSVNGSSSYEASVTVAGVVYKVPYQGVTGLNNPRITRLGFKWEF